MKLTKKRKYLNKCRTNCNTESDSTENHGKKMQHPPLTLTSSCRNTWASEALHILLCPGISTKQIPLNHRVELIAPATVCQSRKSRATTWATL